MRYSIILYLTNYSWKSLDFILDLFLNFYMRILVSVWHLLKVSISALKILSTRLFDTFKISFIETYKNFSFFIR
jgi:hypothetical protein